MDFVLKDETQGDTHSQQDYDMLKADVEKYGLLFSSSNTGAWEYFPATGFFDSNSVNFTMLGRDIKDYDLPGKRTLDTAWADLLHPDDKAGAMARLMEYISNPVDSFESFFRMKHANGKWVWICSRGGYNKKSNSITGVHIDVTNQKKTEEDVQKDRKLLRTLIDNLPGTIYIKDEKARKIIANKADVATIGAKSEADVIGKTDLELFPNEIGLRGYQNDMEVLCTGEAIINKEEVFYDSSGEQHWLSTSKVPVYDEYGKITRILGIGHNITDRKRSEEALNKLNKELNAKSAKLSKQTEELKALNEMLVQQQEQETEKAIAQGKFEIASEVLHDIGNALVGFGSYLTRINRVSEKNNLESVKNLNLFLKGHQTLIGNAIGVDKANALVSITEGIAKTQADNQKEVSVSIGELLNIVSHIQEILNIQRQFVRGHGGSHERKPVNIVRIIDDCRSMLFASMDKKGVKLIVNIKPGNYVIKGDHTKLMQVILNIMKNSLEAIDMDKSEKCISITMKATAEYIDLKIADTGQGFDKETSSRFFERGFTTKKSGTGLGLYNCRSIVESHTGSFEISSDGPGLGAVTAIKFSL